MPRLQDNLSCPRNSPSLSPTCPSRLLSSAGSRSHEHQPRSHPQYFPRCVDRGRHAQDTRKRTIRSSRPCYCHHPRVPWGIVRGDAIPSVGDIDGFDEDHGLCGTKFSSLRRSIPGAASQAPAGTADERAFEGQDAPWKDPHPNKATLGWCNIASSGRESWGKKVPHRTGTAICMQSRLGIEQKNPAGGYEGPKTADWEGWGGRGPGTVEEHPSRVFLSIGEPKAPAGATIMGDSRIRDCGGSVAGGTHLGCFVEDFRGCSRRRRKYSSRGQ